MTNQMHSAARDVLICSCCGRNIPVYPAPSAEDYVEITKKWGYFSRKDGETHRLTICETCYDAWLASFTGPVEKTEDTELV